MEKLKNVSLKTYNSFGIDVSARQMFFVNDIYELTDSLNFIQANNTRWMLLGGGSNILFTDNYDGTIIKLSLKGIQVLYKTTNHVYIRVNGGEEWDDFVNFCVENNWGGVENLSYIPGKIGASPIQNIGAYGVELKDCFHSLEAMEINSGVIKRFKKNDCNFGYRSSVFKTELKDKYVICSVIFKLDLQHKIKRNYKAIDDYLIKNSVKSPGISNIRQAVINIRKSKLPDPKFLGNAGSFFKNPVISNKEFETVKNKHPEIVAYKENNGNVKIPAGWLIEKTGWKGFRKGDAGVYDKQALVIVNHGNADGKQILALAKMIQKSVYENFGIKLEPEVNII